MPPWGGGRLGERSEVPCWNALESSGASPMRSVLAFAFVVLIAATAVPRYYGRGVTAPVPAAPAARVARPAPSTSASSYGTMTIQSSPNGQFNVNAVVDGRHM